MDPAHIEPSNYTSTLLLGLAQHLSEHSIGTYQADGYSDDTPFGIVFQTMPEHPARCIVLSFADTEDRPDVNLSSTFVQVRLRCGDNPLEGLDLIDRIRDLLHRAQHLTFGNVAVTNIVRTSSGPLGLTANNQHEFVSTFRVTGSRWIHPATNPESTTRPPTNYRNTAPGV